MDCEFIDNIIIIVVATLGLRVYGMNSFLT